MDNGYYGFQELERTTKHCEGGFEVIIVGVNRDVRKVLQNPSFRFDNKSNTMIINDEITLDMTNRFPSYVCGDRFEEDVISDINGCFMNHDGVCEYVLTAMKTFEKDVKDSYTSVVIFNILIY